MRFFKKRTFLKNLPDLSNDYYKNAYYIGSINKSFSDTAKHVSVDFYACTQGTAIYSDISLSQQFKHSILINFEFINKSDFLKKLSSLHIESQSVECSLNEAIQSCDPLLFSTLFIEANSSLSSPTITLTDSTNQFPHTLNEASVAKEIFKNIETGITQYLAKRLGRVQTDHRSLS